MKKILIIEDELDFIQLLKNTFESNQYEVITALDGKQGIIEATKNFPDFILLDLIMPGMDGTTFLKHINSIEGLNKIPIALLTAVPDGVPQKLHSEELFENIVDYWVKDMVTPKEILEKVNIYLSKQSDKI